VSAFATILHSRTLARAAHSTKSPVRVGQVYPCRICRRAASLKDPARLGFCWPQFRSLHAHLPEPQIHRVCHPLSNLRLCYLPHVSYHSDEACAHRVLVYCYLFTKSSSCSCSFFNWATPVKLCSSLFCMLIDCLLHQFLGSIQERVRVPHQKHVVNKPQQQVVNVRLCLSAISITTCRLDNICKEVLPYLPDLFYVVCTYSP